MENNLKQQHAKLHEVYPSYAIKMTEINYISYFKKYILYI